MEDALLARVVEALRPVQGLSALVLGGSRGRGTAGPTSDYDIGLYYEPDAPIDVEALRSAIAPLVDDPLSTVTQIGEWGPWINGGGWLTIGGVEVEIAARRAELTHIAGCAYRALCCAAQVLFALNGRYLINEKGAVAEAATYPITIEGLADA